jgi:RNA polymerase sigma-70 factor (ECF subfamily)
MSPPVPAISPDWLERALGGQAEAFGPVVEANQAAVFNLCLRMLGDPEQAEDAAQETFLRAFRRLQGYDPGRPIRTWLLSIAAHHCVDRLRRRAILRFEPIGDFEPPSSHGNPEPTVLRTETERETRRLLEKLDPLERAIVTMRYWHDLPLEEIAAAVGKSPQAVRTRLYRARRRMAREMAPEPVGLDVGESVNESPSL